MASKEADPTVLQHTMLTVDGPVYAWGNNTHGQLRDGTTILRKTPVAALLPDGLAAIEAASNVAYALRSDGSVLAWGHNLEGKIGDGTEVDRFEPVTVAGLADIVQIAAAGDWACALRRDGTVWAWGSNTVGQMGNGTTHRGRGPAHVRGLSDVVSVAAGLGTGFALRRDGTVWAWGYHAHGECGGFQTGNVCLAPVQVTSDVGEGDVVAMDGVAYRSLGGIVAISAGAFAGYAVTANGEVWSWGANELGQLGNGSTRSGFEDALAAVSRHDSPKKIVGLTGVVSVVSKCNTAYALNADGTVWSWGDNRHGALGSGSTSTSGNVPQRVSGLTDVVAVAANGDSAYALKSDGTVWAWGENEYGELGDGTRIDRALPVQVVDLEAITSISAGITSAYATAGRRTSPAFGSAAAPEVYSLPGERTLLMHWSAVGDEDQVVELLRDGTDINAVDVDGDTALYYAVSNGNLEIAEVLLEHGADPDLAGANGTCVRFAADKGWVDLLKLLLQRGADASGADADGITAAMLAAGGGKNEILEELNRYGADFDETDRDGDTALFYAVSRGRASTAELLVSAGASAGPPANASGHTPLVFASMMAVSPQQRPAGTTADDYNAIVRTLLRAGADPTQMFGIGVGLARRVMNGLDFALNEYVIASELDDDWFVTRLAPGQAPHVVQKPRFTPPATAPAPVAPPAAAPVASLVEVLGSTQPQSLAKTSVKVFWNGLQVGVVEHNGRLTFDIETDGEIRFKSRLRSRRVRLAADGPKRIELSWDATWGRLIAKVT
ncbi:ankyrin repeat domain-containing protein [Nocardioides sp.]|uniref:ankyrin repeat domain-containing protein n=1 Tax=Nocardioides sp. TaxID=35761 RepID=UPI002623B54F|nr:ankyrin repeat domain-containing protein [Nocardioides sp.]MDI6911825.1 ankyrin repeat domain-containing protein [Nocardioides sp.]